MRMHKLFWRTLGAMAALLGFGAALAPQTAAAAAISNLSVADIDSNAATIKFDVNELVTLVIRYGTSTAYGLSQAHPMFMTSHSERLMNLSPATLYHYRIELTNQSGAVTVIPDQTFTTIQGASPWVFEESFNGLNPATPSQDLLPRTFDYVVTHRSHPASLDGYDPATGSFGSYLADHGDACEGGLPFPQHMVLHTSHRSNGSSPDESFYNCNGHMMSSMGHVDGYSVTGFWTKQEFDFSGDGVLEWDVNINGNPGRSWWEVAITPRDQNQLGEAQDWLPIDETYPKDRIILTFSNNQIRSVQIGKDQAPPAGWYVDAHDWRSWEPWVVSGDPASTDRRIRRKNRVELLNNVNGTGNGKLRWSIEKPDGTFDAFEADVPGGFSFTRGIVMFKTHAYTPKKDGNHNIYTYHWDNIRFNGPKITPYENYESTGIVYLSANGNRRIGDTETAVINLPYVGPNPTLEGQTHGGMVGQILLSVNGRPNIEVRPAVSPSNQPDTCAFGGWRTFHIDVDPSWLKPGQNTFQWTVGPRAPCATWEWDGFSVKAFEVQFDGVEGQPAATVAVPQNGSSVSGTINIVAAVTDPTYVQGVQLQVDGANLGAEDTSSPYIATWNTSTVSDGEHVLTAVLRNNQGQLKTSPPVRFRVSNNVDVAPPSVSMMETPDSTARGLVTYTAAASDNVGVVGVQFKIDGTNFGPEDATAPYTATLDSTLFPDYWYTITAVARDAAGNRSTSGGYGIYINNTGVSDTELPTVSISTPAANAILSGTAQMSAEAADNQGVIGVQFKVDGAPFGSEIVFVPYTMAFNSALISNGTHTVTAVARDLAGNARTSAGVVFRVSNAAPVADTIPPAVSFTNVASGAVISGIFTLNAAASDNVGVAGVQFKVDGANLGVEDLTAPYSADWDSLGAVNGTHTLSVVARDAAGNSSMQTVTVTKTIRGACSPNQWKAEYFTGTNLAGTPVLTRCEDAAPSYNWGAGSPDPAVPVDNFSARWTATLPFSAGITSFTTVTDDGARLYVDSASVINDWNGHTATTNTASVSLATGTHHLRFEYFDSASEASAKISWVTTASDTARPTVNLSQPASGAVVTGTVTVSAAATDNVGIAGVRFRIDATNFGVEDTTAPYSASLNSSLFSNGPHALTAIARDAAGNVSTSAAVSITISNSVSSSTGTNKIRWQGQSWNISGVNVPWYNWAADFGGGAGGGGVSGNLATLRAGFQQLEDRNIHAVRWWVFPGDPWQITRDGAGMPTGLNDAIYADFDAALQLAADHDIYYNFTLFSGPTAIPASWINDAAQRAKLAEVLAPLFARYGSNPRVMTWEIFNEPEFEIWNGNVNEASAVDLAKRIADAVHANSSALVTIGNAFADGMPMWESVNLDYYSPHWYDYMSSGNYCIRCNDYNFYRNAYNITKPIVVGEFFAGPTTDAQQRFEDFYAKGFAGAWAWSLFPSRTSDQLAVDLAAQSAFTAAHSDIGPRGSGGPDVTPPSVSFSTPTNGATVAGNRTVIAVPTDNVGINRVEFLVDGVLKVTAMSSPYLYIWDTTELQNGPHQLAARAYDTALNTGISSITVNVANPDNTAPAISSVTAINIGQSSATVRWNTNEPADTQVLYGLTTSYGSTTTLNAALLSSHTQVLTGLAPDQLYHYQVRSRDASGNVAASSDFTFRTSSAPATPPDTTRPTIGILSPADNATVSSTLTITGSASDNVGLSSVEIKIGTAPFAAAQGLSNWSYFLNTFTLSNGTVTVIARATDLSGNTQNSTRTFNVVNASTGADLIAPQTALTAPQPNAFISGTVNVSGTATDNTGVTLVQFLINGVIRSTDSAAPYAFSWNTVPEPNGAYSLTLRAFDAALNVASHTITINVNNDSAAPVIANVTAPFVGFSSATLTWTTDENSDSQVEYGTTAVYGLQSALNAALVTAHSASLTGLAMNQLYHYRVKSRDASGNLAVSQDQTFTTLLRVDGTSPTVMIVAPSSGALLSGIVEISGTAADDTALAKVEVSLDSGTYQLATGAQNWSFSLNTLSLASGTHRIDARATDTSGNSRNAARNVQVLNVILDGIAPTVSFLSPAPNVTVSSLVVVKATAADNIGVNRVDFYVDGTLKASAANAPHEFNWNSAAELNGARQLRATAYDAFGNFATANISVNVNNPDLTAPVVSITAPADNAYVKGTVQVSAQITDERSGVARAELYVDGILRQSLASEPYQFTWTARKETKGRHSIEVRAYDAAGNRGSQTIHVQLVKTRISLVMDPSGTPVNGIIPLLLILNSNDPVLEGNSFRASFVLNSQNHAIDVTRLQTEPDVLYGRTDTSKADPDAFNALDDQDLSINANGQTADAIVSPNIIVSGLGARIRDNASQAEVIFMPGSVGGDAQIGIFPETMEIEARREALKNQNLISLGDAQEFAFVSTSGITSARILLRFNRALVPQGGSDKQLRIAYFNPATRIWEPQNNTRVNGDRLECDVTHFSLYKPVFVSPSNRVAQTEAYAYPNPALAGRHPTIRAFLGRMEQVEIYIFDVSGRRVHFATVSGDPSGILDDRYFYDYAWTEPKASGVYTAILRGSGPEGEAQAKTRFAVVQ